MFGLPNSIVLDGSILSLRFPLPKIWTQQSGRAFGIYWSDASDHGVLHPEPTESELASYYDIATYGDYLSGMDNRKTDRSVVDRIVVKLAYTFDNGVRDPLPSIMRLANKNPSVCDLGCGSGAFLERIRETGAAVVGVDPSDVSGKSTTGRGIEFHHGTAEQLPEAIARRQFDVVTMFQSLEHCRNPKLALENAKSILRPGGLLCVDVPNMGCLGFRLYRQAWFHCDAGRHLQFFTPRSLKEACRRAGLEPIEAEYVGFTGQFTRLWIQSMRECWDNLFSNDSRSAPPRPSTFKSVLYLIAAALAPRRLKYDIVRVYARA